MNRPVRILIVDDSALVRNVLRQVFASDSELEVVGAVGDPIAAGAAMDRLAPDVLTLDVEMPRMDGITFLERLMSERPMPVVMVSSLTERNCELTLRSLELGAIDFVTKPKVDIERGTVELADQIIAKVKAAARARVVGRRAAVPADDAPPEVTLRSAPLRMTHKLVAIGASTGGTEAIRKVLIAFPADAPPVVVVQHMPPVFTKQFAARLDQQCRVRVREANDKDTTIPGHVLIAPGGEMHLELARDGARYMVRLRKAPPVKHHRPSINVLFESVAREAGANAIGVVLTGMGDDGADGLLAMRQAGARTIAQDERTSVVYGMPKEAAARGGAELIVPLEKIAAGILHLARDGVGSSKNGTKGERS